MEEQFIQPFSKLKEKYNYLDTKDQTNKLGQGGYGEVFKIRRKSDNKWYAAKIMTEKDPYYVEQTKQEIKFLYQFREDRKEFSPYLVDYVDSYFHVDEVTDNHTFFLILELGESNLLKKFQNTIATPEECKYYTKQILKGLIYLKKRGIYHRDLKPENILLFRQGRQVCITDFGVSRYQKKEDTRIAQFSSRVGTAPYLSPEMFNEEGNYIPQKCDIFSLGITILKLCSFEQISGLNCNQQRLLERIRQVQDNELRTILSMMLNYNAQQRATYEEVLDLLEGRKNNSNQFQILEQEKIRLEQQLQVQQQQHSEESHQLMNQIQILDQEKIMLQQQLQALQQQHQAQKDQRIENQNPKIISKKPEITLTLLQKPIPQEKIQRVEYYRIEYQLWKEMEENLGKICQKQHGKKLTDQFSEERWIEDLLADTTADAEWLDKLWKKDAKKDAYSQCPNCSKMYNDYMTKIEEYRAMMKY